MVRGASPLRHDRSTRDTVVPEDAPTLDLSHPTEAVVWRMWAYSPSGGLLRDTALAEIDQVVIHEIPHIWSPTLEAITDWRFAPGWTPVLHRLTFQAVDGGDVTIGAMRKFRLGQSLGFVSKLASTKPNDQQPAELRGKTHEEVEAHLAAQRERHRRPSQRPRGTAAETLETMRRLVKRRDELLEAYPRRSPIAALEEEFKHIVGRSQIYRLLRQAESQGITAEPEEQS